MSVHLRDKNACFVDVTINGVTRTGVGVQLECPCGCDNGLWVPFAEPLDGGPPVERGWSRTGDTIDTLTLSPSVLRVGGCGWHGWIRDGQAVSC